MTVTLAVGLETSTRPVSIAARLGGRVVVRLLEEDRRHASDLLPNLDALLRELDQAPADIDLVVVGRGPGSYTGLRVGAATALGLARGADARLVGVPSFEALAFAALAPGQTAAVVQDARGGHVYIARYVRTDGSVEEQLAPTAVRPDEVADLVADAPIVLGEAAPGLSEAQLERLDPVARPTAEALLALSDSRGTDDVTPLYLRPFEARVRKR